MEDLRLTKIECVVELLIEKGIITKKEIADKYNKKIRELTDYERDCDKCHR